MNLFGANVNMNLFGGSGGGSGEIINGNGNNNLSHNEKDIDEISEHSCFSNEIDQESYMENNQNVHNSSFENNEDRDNNINNNNNNNEDINGEDDNNANGDKFKKLKEIDSDDESLTLKENEIKFSLIKKRSHHKVEEDDQDNNHEEEGRKFSKRTSSLSDTEVTVGGDSEKRIKLKHFSETGSNSNF
jgi:hypothetical protein